MILINTLNEKSFQLNGITTPKVYIPIKVGSDSISLVNVYDTRQVIISSVKYDEVTIDGEVKDDVVALIGALVPLTFEFKVDDDVLDAFAEDVNTELADFQTQINSISSGFKGTLLISDIPTEDGIYYPTESGTYTNAGGLIIDLNGGLTVIIKTGVTFEGVTYPIDLSGYLTDQDKALTLDPTDTNKVATGKAVADYTNLNVTDKAQQTISYTPVPEVDIFGTDAFHFATVSSVTHHRTLLKGAVFNKIEACLYLVEMPENYNYTIKVHSSETLTEDLSKWTELFSEDYNQDSKPNAAFPSTKISIQLPDLISLKAGSVIYVTLWSSSTVVASRKIDAVSLETRFLISGDFTNFPTSFEFAGDDRFGTTGLNLYNTSSAAKDLINTSQSAEGYEREVNSNVQGTGFFTNFDVHSSGQYTQALKDFEFNNTVVGFQFENLNEYTVEAKIFKSAIKTNDPRDMIYLDSMVFVESQTDNNKQNLDSLEVHPDSISITWSRSFKIKKNEWVYIIIYSPQDLYSIRTFQNTSPDNRVIYSIQNTGAFPIDYLFAEEAIAQTTGINFYLLNPITAIDKKAVENTKRLNELNPEPSVNSIFFPKKLNLISGQKNTFYKSSIIKDVKNLLKKFITVSLPSSTNTGFKVQRHYSGFDDVSLNSNEISETIGIHYKDLSTGDNFSIRDIEISIADVNSKDGQTIRYNNLGDSLTNRGVGNAIDVFLNNLGSTINVVNVGSQNNYYDTLGEGREGWTFGNFIGKDRTHHYGGSVANNPFLKLANATDKANKGDWCFTNTGSANETSYTNVVDKNQDFYIFDYANYLLTYPNITHASIALGSNDLIHGENAGSEIELGLTVMVSQMKEAIPSLKIGVVVGTIKAFGYELQNETFDSIQTQINKIEELGFSDVEPIPVYAFQNQFFDFPDDDKVHFFPSQLPVYAQAMVGWILNS
ncbi:hypothetical protein [Leeuwenhoekiella sp. NPDC079379]|uniref:hypothetical protein n=1 Tax=Leeuwenhoekiella sp. NPDC079379 TaxID=3364122 RepID=UPI0037C95F98